MTSHFKQRDELIAAYQDRFIDMLQMYHALEGEGLEDAFRATPRHRFVHHYLDTRRPRPRMAKVDPRRPSVAQLEQIYSNEGSPNPRGTRSTQLDLAACPGRAHARISTTEGGHERPKKWELERAGSPR